MDNKELIQRELDARAKDETEARAILDAAAEAGTDLTPEDEERFDKLVASSTARKARIDKLHKMDEDAASLAEARELATVDENSGVGSVHPKANEMLLEAIRAKQEEFRRTGTINSPETALILPFDMGQVEQRVISDFANNTALYTSDFTTNVAVYMRTETPWLGASTIINADNGRPQILPNLTADPTVYTPGEGTAIDASDPTLGTVTATPVSYKALAYVTAEAEEDEVIGLMPLIARQQARALGQAFGSATTTAVLAAASNGGTATGLGGGSTATFLGTDDLFSLKYGRAAPYRRAGSWVMSNGAIQKVRKFKDLNGQYLWQASVIAGSPDTFDGNAVLEDPYLAAPASATKSIIFGDLSNWVIKQRALRTAVSYEFAFNLDNIAIKSVYRAGGALPDAAGIAYLVSADT